MGRSRSSAASFNTECILCLILIILLVLSPGIAARKLADSRSSVTGVKRSTSSPSPSARGKNNNPAAAGNAGNTIAYGALKTPPICKGAGSYRTCVVTIVPKNSESTRGCKTNDRCH